MFETVLKDFHSETETVSTLSFLHERKGVSWVIFSHSSIKSYVIQGKKKPIRLSSQRAKKVMSDSPGLVDFAIGPVIFVLNLPNGQVLFFGAIQIT